MLFSWTFGVTSPIFESYELEMLSADELNKEGMSKLSIPFCRMTILFIAVSRSPSLTDKHLWMCLSNDITSCMELTRSTLEFLAFLSITYLFRSLTYFSSTFCLKYLAWCGLTYSFVPSDWFLVLIAFWNFVVVFCYGWLQTTGYNFWCTCSWYTLQRSSAKLL